MSFHRISLFSSICSKSMRIVNINVLRLLVYLSYFSLLFHFCVIFEMAVFHFLSVICLFRQPNPVTCVRFKLFFSSCWFHFEPTPKKKRRHINTWQVIKKSTTIFVYDQWAFMLRLENTRLWFVRSLEKRMEKWADRKICYCTEEKRVFKSGRNEKVQGDFLLNIVISYRIINCPLTTTTTVDVFLCMCAKSLSIVFRRKKLVQIIIVGKKWKSVWT